MDKNSQKLLNFPEYWRIIRRRKFQILIPLITITTTVYIVSLFLKPVYESTTTLYITGTQLMNRNMEMLLPGVTRQQQTAKNIRSKVVNRTNLINLINHMDFKNDVELQAEARLKQEKFPNYSLDEIMNEILLENLVKYISVESTAPEYITIKVKNNKPDRAFEMVKALTNIFIENSLKAELGGLEKVAEFGDEQMTIYKQKLRDAEQRLRNYEKKVRARQVENYNISSIDLNHINNILVTYDIQIEELQDELKQTSDDKNNKDFLRDYSSTSYIKGLIDKYYQRSIDLAELLTQFDWKDPKVIRLNNELIGLKARIGQELYGLGSKSTSANMDNDENIRRALMALEAKSLQMQQAHLKKRVVNYKNLVSSDPAHDVIRRRLQEEVDSYREIYRALIQQKSGSQMKTALQHTEARAKYEIVEPAFRPLKPVSPKRLQLFIIGFGMGLVVGLGIAFLLEYTNDSFKNLEDIEDYLGLVVLGTIPKIHARSQESKWKNYLRLKFIFPVIVLLGGIGIMLEQIWKLVNY